MAVTVPSPTPVADRGEPDLRAFVEVSANGARGQAAELGLPDAPRQPDYCASNILQNTSRSPCSKLARRCGSSG